MDALIGWIGGKRLLRKTISQYVPKDIQGYIEPYGGAAWMLLYKDKWGDLEVYNDLDYLKVILYFLIMSLRPTCVIYGTYILNRYFIRPN